MDQLHCIECEGGGPLDGDIAPTAIIVGANGLAQFLARRSANGMLDVYECEVAQGRARYAYRGRMTCREFDDLQG